MTQLSPGDQVVCRVKGKVIVSPYDSYDYEHIFDIIGYCDRNYIIYVPQSIPIDSIFLSNKNFRNYEIDKRFLDSNICIIADSKVARVHKRLDGMRCAKCKDFFEMAAPNQPDGTMKCWSCRNYPHYK